jgi:hypothetical protein
VIGVRQIRSGITARSLASRHVVVVTKALGAFGPAATGEGSTDRSDAVPKLPSCSINLGAALGAVEKEERRAFWT